MDVSDTKVRNNQKQVIILSNNYVYYLHRYRKIYNITFHKDLYERLVVFRGAYPLD